MRDERVTLSTQDVLEIPADALVIEDSGWLAASRGLAAAVDELYPQLRPLRARALEQHGGPLALGAAIGLALDDAQPLRSVIYAITSGQQSPTASAADQRQRATPLAVAEAARNALLEADRLGATEVAMPALGTRLGYHALPPTPKKLPRYVMGAAQLIGLQQALPQTASVQRVTISLSVRDYAIFHELLGQPLAGLPNDGEQDE